jgi:hypothetical protein
MVFVISRRRALGLAGLVALGGLAGCSLSSILGPAPAVVRPLFAVAPDPYPDDVARFLAGMPGRAESPFKKFEDNKQWRAHAASFDAAFDHWNNGRRPRIAAFQKTELAGPDLASATAFYPFGGPDVVHVMTFYPDSPEYILVGLEPPGSLAKVGRLAERGLETQLPHVRRTLSDVLGKSFFITRQMDLQLRGQVTDGLLPIMLVQLVRTQAKILGVAPVTLNESGDVVARQPGATPVNPGVAIDFQMPGQTATRQLYYFSLNLADARFSANSSFHNLLAQPARVVSMFKSTSYMPHRKDFSKIRELVLSRSLAIVQDDSGIPFHDYEATQWDVSLYGSYSKPYGSFSYLVQPDLQQAYSEPNRAKPLPFNIGYGFNRAPSNLLIARRKR